MWTSRWWCATCHVLFCGFYKQYFIVFSHQPYEAGAMNPNLWTRELGHHGLKWVSWKWQAESVPPLVSRGRVYFQHGSQTHHLSLIMSAWCLQLSNGFLYHSGKKKKNSQAPRKAPGLLNDLISHHPSSPSHSVPATVLDSLFFWHIPDTLCVWSMHRCLHGSFPHVLQLFTQRWPSHWTQF